MSSGVFFNSVKWSDPAYIVDKRLFYYIQIRRRERMEERTNEAEILYLNRSVYPPASSSAAFVMFWDT